VGEEENLTGVCGMVIMVCIHINIYKKVKRSIGERH
jgi:hypothetical protein